MIESKIPSLWQLRVFETVARLENVSRASQELFRSQPAVTSSIVRLEELLGVTLFDRATTGTYPTAAGLTLLARARRILGAIEQAVRELRGKVDASPAVIASRITRTQMRSLIAIGESRSFVAAAHKIGISEASIQRAARHLERNVGCQLFKHTVSGVTTTEAGSVLAKRMSLIVSQIEAVTDDIHRFEHPKERRVAVGVLLLDPTVLLAKAIRELNHKFKDTRVIMASGGYDALLQKLHADDIDIILGILKHPDYAADIVEEPLYTDKYFVVARGNHPLTRRKSVSLDDLRRYDWILPQRGSPRRLAFEQIFSDASPPNATVETFSLSTIRLLLAESDMLSVLSRTELLSEERIGLVAGLPFDVPGEGPIVGNTMRKGWEPNENQAPFLQALKRASRELKE
ncbi:MAG: LysR family transcriptional regulator [Steroidobacterales bacterium]